MTARWIKLNEMKIDIATSLDWIKAMDDLKEGENIAASSKASFKAHVVIQEAFRSLLAVSLSVETGFTRVN